MRRAQRGLRDGRILTARPPRHHDVDQPSVATRDRQGLLRQIARMLFASEWQRDRYCRRFGVARELTAVVGNPYCESAYKLATSAATEMLE